MHIHVHAHAHTPRRALFVWGASWVFLLFCLLCYFLFATLSCHTRYVLVTTTRREREREREGTKVREFWWSSRKNKVLLFWFVGSCIRYVCVCLVPLLIYNLKWQGVLFCPSVVVVVVPVPVLSFYLVDTKCECVCGVCTTAKGA